MTPRPQATAPQDAPPAGGFDRALPHNLDAERSVLGAILMDNTIYEAVVARLKPRDFYREAHKRIYQAMQRLDEQRVAFEFVTLKNELNRTTELENVGGPAYLASLVDGLPQATNIEYYAGIVKEKAQLRDVIFAATAITAAAYDGELTSIEILQRADGAFLDVSMNADRRTLVDTRNRAQEIYADLEQLVANKGQLTGIDTGFKSINEQTFGWQPADLIILAARPSIGKTAFMLNSAVGAARQGKHVAIFSLEMRRQQLERRMLAFLAGVPLTKIQGGFLSDHDYQGLSSALSILGDLPLHINDRSALTVGDIRMACRRLKRESGVDLIVVDYVQEMRGSLERRGATRNEELEDIGRRFKWLADELSVPVIVLSQLKRIGGNRPTLEDLRDSGSLEQVADVVGLLHRKNHKENGVTNFILEKQRNGPTGSVNLNIDRDIQLFTDGGEETVEQASQAETERQQAAKTKAIIRNRSRRAN